MRISVTEVSHKEYSVRFDPDTSTITFQGTLSLGSTEEYGTIAQLLNEAIGAAPDHLTLDVSQLEFLNSSGINMLSKFVIKVRQSNPLHLTIQGSSQATWQTRSLKNLQRLMPTLALVWM